MNKQEKLVAIAVDIPARTNFTYETDVNLIPGQRVRVPFGKRKMLGWMVGPGLPGDFNYKYVLGVYDEYPIIPEHLLRLASEMAESYFSSLGNVLSTMSKNLSLKKKIFKSEEIKKPVVNLDRESFTARILQDLRMQEKKTCILKFSSSDEKGNFFLDVPKSCEGSCMMVFSNLKDVERYSKILQATYGSRVIVFTAEMKKTEKTINWKRMLEEKNLIIIGTRYCLFSPVGDLSLVIVDEPSEYGHKELKQPKYNSREVALMISKIHDIPVFFSVFQPDVHETFMIKTGRAIAVESRQVVTFPEIVISHIKDRFGKQFLTELSKHFLEKTLMEKRRVVIIHNIKGYARLIICKKCADVLLCQYCGGAVIPVSDRYVYCSRCKKFSLIPAKCPACKKGTLSIRQPGIKKVVENLKETYHDFDISVISDNENPDFSAHIIIGTQHIIQHLEQISPALLIFANADTIAAKNAFRSEEKFFLLAEKIKRLMQGKDRIIIIQTKNPGFDVYGDVVRNDTEAFYRRELSIREKLQFPPYGDLIEISFSGKRWQQNKDNVFSELEKFGEIYEISSGKKDVFWWKISDRKNAFELLEKAIEKYGITKISVDTTPYF